MPRFKRKDPIRAESAFSVFINGIAGVFAGLGVLYVTMKLGAWLAGISPEKTD